MKMKAWFKDNWNKELLFLLPTLIWIVALTLLNLFCGTHVLNSDISAELVLAKEMARTNRLFTTQWYYSTEVRIFYTQIVAMFFFKFINSWNLVRTLTNFVFFVLLLWSYLYFAKPLKISRRSAYLSSLFLFIPFSMEYIYIVHIGNSYIPHFIVIFLGMGMMLRLIEQKSRWCMALYLVLGFYAGLCGVRFLTAYAMPMILCGVMKIVLENYRGESSLFDINTLKQRTFMVPLLGCISCLVGLLTNMTVLSKIVCVGSRNTMLVNILDEKGIIGYFDAQITEILRLFGYYDFSDMATLRGIASFASVVIVIALTLIVIALVRRYHSLNSAKQFALLLFLMSLLVNAVLFIVVCGTMAGRYYMPTLILLAPLLGIYLDEKELLKFDFHKLVAILLVIAMHICGISQFNEWIRTDLNAPYKQVVKFMLDNNLTFGLTSYWNTGVLNELSDGRIEAYTVSGDDITQPHKWLTFKKYEHSQTWYHTGSDKLYFLLDDNFYEENMDLEMIQEGEIVYEEQGYIILIYDKDEFIRKYGHYYLVD